ncbi:MAG: hypothetical protein AAB281_05595 [Actinomycetota bacterium]
MDNIRLETQAIRVLVITDDYEIHGSMHIKPGGYQGRVSDLLNHKEVRYIPITDATFKSLEQTDEVARADETLIVRVDTIKMVAPDDEDAASV